jgi:competence protein ComEC
MAGEVISAPSIALRDRKSGRARLRLGTWPAALEEWLEAERDQLALWLPVALAAGIAAWFALPERIYWYCFLAIGCGGAALAMALDRGSRAARWSAILCLTAVLGCLLAWSRSDRVAAPVLARPVVAELSGRIEAVNRLPAKEAVRLWIALDPQDGLPPRVRINLDADKATPQLLPGARIKVRARLVPPPPPAIPGSYDFARVAWFWGIGATGKALDPVTVTAPPPGGGGFMRWVGDRRAQLTAHIQTRLAGSEGGVAAAFVTGDTGAITQEDSDAFRQSGLAHLLSISGLHVTAVVAATMLLALRLLALSPWLALRAPLPLIAAGAGALAGIGYTLLSGAEVPTVRSCVAALLVLAGIALGREAVTLRLVAAGALVVLLFRPEAVVGPSFQLSFAAVTAIIAFHAHPGIRAWVTKREESWPRRLLRELAALLATGVLVEVALAPIAAYHFHRAGLYGAFANIVAIPLTTFIIMPLEALALLLDMAGLGAPAWWLAGKGLAFLVGLARYVAAVPGAVTALPSMPRGAFALMIAGGLWIALWRTRARRLGMIPLAIGASWALLTLPPDLLVTGDGKHLAIRSSKGALYLLRPRAGDYVRAQLSEGSGVQAEALDLDALPGARCTRDLCLAVIERDGRRWRLLATRSPYFLDADAFKHVCGWADIAVSDRRLPWSCKPRWLKLDRPALSSTGGIAIGLGPPRVGTVIGSDRHPWVVQAQAPLKGVPRRFGTKPFRRKRAPAGDGSERVR